VAYRVAEFLFITALNAYEFLNDLGVVSSATLYGKHTAHGSGTLHRYLTPSSTDYILGHKRSYNAIFMLLTARAGKTLGFYQKFYVFIFFNTNAGHKITTHEQRLGHMNATNRSYTSEKKREEKN